MQTILCFLLLNDTNTVLHRTLVLYYGIVQVRKPGNQSVLTIKGCAFQMHPTPLIHQAVGACTHRFHKTVI